MIIHAERDSVCAGDDCNAPNAKDIMLDTRARVSELLEKVSEYVPNMHNSVWPVMKDCEKSNKILGFVVFDENGSHYCELAVPDGNIQTLGIDKIFCRYFHRRTSIWHDDCWYMLEKCYPQYERLIDMVKAALEYEKSKTV
ncbi:MAG: hypothetical protein K2N72_14440 [Oscillospiraceae bacterium]|nr:hypothetical protein [Oscillospiraceae bacterium]